ncbi:MAG: GGDEF domain-containing protein [Christensenellaceae bacterium]
MDKVESMITSIKQFFEKNYFDKSFPLEYRIYMIFFMESFLISILSATTNTLLQKGLMGIIFQWSYIVFCAVIFFVSPQRRMQFAPGMLLFLSFVYIPFLYFQTAGYDGTALMFSLLAIFLLAIIFKGKQRVWVITLNLLVYLACVFIQFKFPSVAIPHGGEQAKVVDLVVALSLSGAGLAIMTVYITRAFEIEQERIRTLMEELEKSNNSLEELTNRDALTGIYNRRFLTQFMERELETCEQTGNSICVMMLDLDHFKRINDTYGHGFGDEVLIKFTQTVKESLRSYDVLARFGGEEFVVVLHDISLTAAKEIAGRVLRSVSNMEFRNNERITVSIGLVQSRRGEDIDSLIGRTDTCLYQAKNQGRNRVVSEK